MTRRSDEVLADLVRHRYAALLARARMLVRDPVEAQDLVQDALVAAFGGRARFTSVPAAEQYVRRTLATRYVDGLRRRERERVGVAHLAALPEAPAPDAGTESTLLGADVVNALATIAPQERACVVLRHVEDLSVRDTAALLRLSEGAVKRYTSDGVRALSTLLGADPPDPAQAGTPVRLVPTQEERRG